VPPGSGALGSVPPGSGPLGSGAPGAAPYGSVPYGSGPQGSVPPAPMPRGYAPYPGQPGPGPSYPVQPQAGPPAKRQQPSPTLGGIALGLGIVLLIIGASAGLSVVVIGGLVAGAWGIWRLVASSGNGPQPPSGPGP